MPTLRAAQLFPPRREPRHRLSEQQRARAERKLLRLRDDIVAGLSATLQETIRREATLQVRMAPIKRHITFLVQAQAAMTGQGTSRNEKATRQVAGLGGHRTLQARVLSDLQGLRRTVVASLPSRRGRALTAPDDGTIGDARFLAVAAALIERQWRLQLPLKRSRRTRHEDPSVESLCQLVPQFVNGSPVYTLKGLLAWIEKRETPDSRELLALAKRLFPSTRGGRTRAADPGLAHPDEGVRQADAFLRRVRQPRAYDVWWMLMIARAELQLSTEEALEKVGQLLGCNARTVRNLVRPEARAFDAWLRKRQSTGLSAARGRAGSPARSRR